MWGSSDQWIGLGIFFDSFDNDNKADTNKIKQTLGKYILPILVIGENVSCVKGPINRDLNFGKSIIYNVLCCLAQQPVHHGDDERRDEELRPPERRVHPAARRLPQRFQVRKINPIR